MNENENVNEPKGSKRDRQSTDDRDQTSQTSGLDGNKDSEEKAKAKRAAALQSWGDLQDEKIEEPKILISGILQKGHVMALGAKSKQGKSWTLQNLAMCLVTGGKWFGLHQCYKSNVLYVNFEILKFNFRKRIRIICTHLGIDPNGEEIREKLTCWNLKGRVPKYQEFREDLLDALEKAGFDGHKFDVIVIDPWYRMAAGIDENSAGAVGGVLNEFEAIAEEFDLAVIYIAHFSKGNQAGKDPMDRISGSGVHGRLPDVIVTITEIGEKAPNCYAVEYTIRDFSKRDRAVGDHTVRWNEEKCVFEYEPDVRPEVKTKTTGREEKFDLDEFVELLAWPMTSTEWAKAALKEMGMSKGSYDRYRREAMAEGLVVQVGNLYKKAAQKRG
jgi:hypothetical protein